MDKKNRSYKIALVGDSLAGGGAEKVHATLSDFFSGNGIEVHNIIVFDSVAYSYSGELCNLGKMKNVTILDKLKKVYALRKYIRKHHFDCVIDFRYRVNPMNEFLIGHFAYNCPKIYMVHSGIIEYYIPKNTILKKLIYGNATAIQTVSNRITEVVQSSFKVPVVTIYNPLDLKKTQSLSNLFIPEEKNYIVAVGRMNEPIKQFDKLIEAYSKSILPERKIKLLLVGDGKFKGELVKLVDEKSLTTEIVFAGHQENPFPYQKNALFSVLSSKNEGFPNVLIESLAVGTPVVSFDCFTGPSEIIQHRQNGLLVEDQNIEKLTDALNLMIEDQELYQTCKRNATNSVQKFSMETIGKQWLDLLKKYTNKA